MPFQNKTEMNCELLTCKQVLFIARVSAVNLITPIGAVLLSIAVPDFGKANSRLNTFKF